MRKMLIVALLLISQNAKAIDAIPVESIEPVYAWFSYLPPAYHPITTDCRGIQPVNDTCLVSNWPWWQMVINNSANDASLDATAKYFEIQYELQMLAEAD